MKKEKIEVVTRVKDGSSSFRILETNGKVLMESEVFSINGEALVESLDFIVAFSRLKEINEMDNQPGNYSFRILNSKGKLIYKKTFEDRIKRMFHILTIRIVCKNIITHYGRILQAEEVLI